MFNFILSTHFETSLQGKRRQPGLEIQTEINQHKMSLRSMKKKKTVEISQYYEN